MQHADHHPARLHLAAHQPHERDLVRRVEVRGRLVEQQPRRADRERAREQHALALAARKLVQAAQLPGAAFGIAHRLIDEHLVGGRRRGKQAERRQAAEVHELAHRELATRLALLREPCDLHRTVARRRARQRSIVQENVARIRRLQAGERTQQGRLAGAVRADDRGPAGGHGEAHLAQRLRAAERDADLLGAQAALEQMWLCHFA